MGVNGEPEETSSRVGTPTRSSVYLADPSPWFSVIWLFSMVAVGIGAAGGVILARYGPRILSEFASRADIPSEVYVEMCWLVVSVAATLALVAVSGASLKFIMLRYLVRDDAEAVGFGPRLSRTAALRVFAASSLLSAAVGAGLAFASLGGKV
ncbi:hypothetical protein [Salinarimonas soli]|uniref:Uncharacterized protein n=1 Tax=Salinarimonas soli TaxID=1638099 RepID=A0A5B2VVZ3_9HYPH|nr:hypothetical protein [Salinarimonas soli]KAA2243993.1 hypothetical protein F0L46_01725 [Salinarimonas soli]